MLYIIQQIFFKNELRDAAPQLASDVVKRSLHNSSMLRCIKNIAHQHITKSNRLFHLNSKMVSFVAPTHLTSKGKYRFD